ncbi:secreted ookinete protein, putative [Plasmodium chabaudi chabaudi]|uniref:Secreted ookinete protein, putative n=1 Tax=Plasmodium chabaudi chabaudi TaxID=31271 RepID=A0A077TPS3_PLACU|nr:secreted ookinete protein, putative [Plasmodium chabaudi chabaudi]SCN62336.1 secreted ookinete protein, putative [Plasmodium chabaudi chabaudi]VTZ69813.1 secreted ookinete protein, putative [Plasmodium chabaudi chabaudi]|eukprot:XP_016654323.1 secreted ookinete protein, putative [Plasmodium chabaudi chabaudi]
MNKLFYFFFCFFLNIFFNKVCCEKTALLPFSDIMSTVSDIADVISPKGENDVEPTSEPLTRINLKIVPSKKLNISKNDMVFLLSELKQEIRRQVSILEEELEEKERNRRRSSSLWSTNQAPVYVPEEGDDKQIENIDDTEKEEIENLLDSLNKIGNDEDENNLDNISFDIKINKDKKLEDNQEDFINSSRFKQASFRNGPITPQSP